MRTSSVTQTEARVRVHSAAARAAGILYITGTMAGVLSVVVLGPVGEVMSAGSGTASPAGTRLGGLLIDQDEVGAVLALVFCFGGLLLYLLLCRSRIVPRWIAVWGLAAIPFYAWMIVKGFDLEQRLPAAEGQA